MQVLLDESDLMDQSEHLKTSTFNSYWQKENFSCKSYLRAEEWLKDLGDFMFPSKRVNIPLTLSMGRALLRYREELKMYAHFDDENHPNRTHDAIDDEEFLRSRHEAATIEWPSSKGERSTWWESLKLLEEKINVAIEEMQPNGAFVKLSVRSPKDAARLMPGYKNAIKKSVEGRNIHPHDAKALSDDIRAIKSAGVKVDGVGYFM